MTSRKNNARNEAGAKQVTKLAGGVTGNKKVFDSGTDHIRNVVDELRGQGLALRSTAADTQLATLPKVLQYLGPRGFSTYEGQAAGYLRIATRIKELKETWEIYTLRQDVVGPDGLFHKGVARYVLTGKRVDMLPIQLNLGLGGA